MGSCAAFTFFFLTLVALCAAAPPDLQGRWFLITEADTDGNTGGDCQTLDYQLVANLSSTKALYKLTRTVEGPDGKPTQFSIFQTFDGNSFDTDGRPGAIIFKRVVGAEARFLVLLDIPTGVPGALSRYPRNSYHRRRAIKINQALGFPPSVVKQDRGCVYLPEPAPLQCPLK